LGEVLTIPHCKKFHVTKHLTKPRARMGNVRGAYKILVGRLEGRRLLERPRRRWEDNIKLDLQEAGREYGLD
jgi:hypothetical protein